MCVCCECFKNRNEDIRKSACPGQGVAWWSSTCLAQKQTIHPEPQGHVGINSSTLGIGFLLCTRAHIQTRKTPCLGSLSLCGPNSGSALSSSVAGQASFMLQVSLLPTVKWAGQTKARACMLPEASEPTHAERWREVPPPHLLCIW